ncbi:MAG: hypothetical protein IJB02_05815 [Oscillospiraceae bacterium]|nr:hypothetical protein [Oscillospiraceae bacterium]
MKSFLITVDTEGDDLWHWKPGREITTENTKYIPRFQELCEKYGFKPVYLTNYEMAKDDRWVQYSAEKARDGQCEIGMHLHAWNTPPEHPMENRFGGNPYITEYPPEVMEQKVATMMELLQQRYEMPIRSHRAGRWATNADYFDILARNGIQIDCSVTPGLDLSGIPGCSANCGNDYRRAPKTPYRIHPDILEIPMTTRRIHHFGGRSIRNRLKNVLLGDEMWLRPIRLSAEPMKRLSERVIKEGNGEYLEFMIHSSELMPGGSIYFKTPEVIERMYEVLDSYFAYVSQMGYCGKTLQEYADNK